MSWNPNRVLSLRQIETSSGAAKKAPVKHGAKGVAPQRRRIRVGIWDLDACAGGLPHLLDQIEEVQDQFSWYAVEAPFQSGLTATGDHVAQAWKQRTKSTMSAAIAQANVLASPLFAAAKPVLKKLPLDWLVLIVRAMIADDADPKEAWANLFSTHDDKTIIISTCDLRRYAAEAKRPFEAAVALNVLSELLAAMVPDVIMQKRTTGSIFDYCERRSDITVSLKRPCIDPQNRAAIPPPLLNAADRIIDAVKSYKGRETLRDFRRAERYFKSPASKKKLFKKASPTAEAPPHIAFESLVKRLSTLTPETPAPKRTGNRVAKSKKPRKET